MRAVIQRVSKASVTIGEKFIHRLGMDYLFCWVSKMRIQWKTLNGLSGKIVNLRIFNDENGVMNLSVKEMNGEISTGQPVYSARIH